MLLLIHNPAVSCDSLSLAHLVVGPFAHFIHYNLRQDILHSARHLPRSINIIHRKRKLSSSSGRAASSNDAFIIHIADIHINITVDAVDPAITGILPHLSLKTQKRFRTGR